MKKIGTGLVCLVALVALAMALVVSSAGASGQRKLVEGTVYDATCASACQPECPPPCGPVAEAQVDVICAQAGRVIACPLETSPRLAAFPVYSGEGAVVKVRRRGSATVLVAPSVSDGHFKVKLGAGEYVLRPFVPGEPCWTGEAWRVKITARTKGPIPVSLDLRDDCVAHPDAR